MKTSRYFSPAAAISLAMALCACQSSAVTDQSASQHCPADPGKAPSGALQAHRIEIANNAAAGLYEGPVWKDGTLYFSHFLFTEGFPSTVLAYDGSELSAVLENAGSNGLALDEKGRLVAGTHKHKAVSRFDLATGARETVAGQYRGRVFNSPNDLTVAGDGTLYFTDPDFQTAAAPGGQPVTGVYRVDNGVVELIDDTIANPNGISLSPDERTLYVAGGGENGFVRAYDLTTEFPFERKQLLESVVVPDGMAVDCLGNLYVTEHTAQRVRVINPDGEVIAHIELDANVTNGAFGGAHGKTLYLTGAGSLWKVSLDVSGLPY